MPRRRPCANGCLYRYDHDVVFEFSNGRKLYRCQNCPSVMAFSGWRQLDSYNQGTLVRIYGAENGAAQVREAVDA